MFNPTTATGTPLTRFAESQGTSGNEPGRV